MHRLEPGAEGQRGLAGAGPAAERDDADRVVEQQVEGDPLLGRPAAQAERLAVAAHQPHLLVRRDPAERRAVRRVQHQAGVARAVRGRREVDRLAGRRARRPRRRSSSISAMPVQSGRSPGRARYSSAASPTAAALTRSGMSLVTSVTSRPSAARPARRRGCARRWCRCRNPAGSTDWSAWLSSTRSVPPSSLTANGASRRPCSTRSSSRIRSACRAKHPIRDGGAWPPAR